MADLNLYQTVLPIDWSGPTENEVIIGRGKRCDVHPGNKRFLAIIRSHLAEYSAALSKAQKTSIILNVLDPMIRNSTVGGFVKCDTTTGRWIAVTELSAKKIVCAQTFRDQLSGKYRSSKKFKQHRRSELKKKATVAAKEDRTTQVVSPNPGEAGEENAQGASSKGPQDTRKQPIPDATCSLDKVPSSMDQAAFQEDRHLLSFLNVFEDTVEFSGNPFEPTPLDNSAAEDEAESEYAESSPFDSLLLAEETEREGLKSSPFDDSLSHYSLYDILERHV